SGSSASAGPADELVNNRRVVLINELAKAMQDVKVDSATWAILWFADIERIQEHIDIINTAGVSRDKSASWNAAAEEKRRIAENIRGPNSRSQSPTKLPRPVDRTKSQSKDGNKHAKEAASQSEINTPIKGRSTSSSPNKTVRSEVAKRLCDERDRNTCLITHFREPIEIAHIYPFSLGSRTTVEKSAFWGVLRNYWFKEMVNSWEAEVMRTTEICSNLMSLVNIVHKLWEKARFALRPVGISEDRKTLTVQFFWLPTYRYRHKVSINSQPTAFPTNHSSCTVAGEEAAKLFDLEKESKIQCGDQLLFHTSDPEKYPLPSEKLLHMQWILHRVLALSGAAEVTDEDLDPYAGMGSGVGIFEEDEEEEEVEELEME
ncbi:hypothetical protein BO78DRAFT_287866, partial [Aspergillus sclerotiicarbonarius CBS 121057]